MSYTWLLCSLSVHILFETSGLGSLYHIIYEVHSLCCNLCYSQTGGVHDQREARVPDGQRSHQHVRPDQQEYRLRRSVHPRGRHQSPIKAICARPLPASCTPQDVSSCLCPSLCLSSPPIGQTASSQFAVEPTGGRMCFCSHMTASFYGRYSGFWKSQVWSNTQTWQPHHMFELLPQASVQSKSFHSNWTPECGLGRFAMKLCFLHNSSTEQTAPQEKSCK